MLDHHDLCDDFWISVALFLTWAELCFERFPSKVQNTAPFIIEVLRSFRSPCVLYNMNSPQQTLQGRHKNNRSVLYLLWKTNYVITHLFRHARRKLCSDLVEMALRYLWVCLEVDHYPLWSSTWPSPMLPKFTIDTNQCRSSATQIRRSKACRGISWSGVYPPFPIWLPRKWIKYHIRH